MKLMSIGKMIIIGTAVGFGISLFIVVGLMLSGYFYGYGTAEFGNWAMWIGAIATICAAVGTVSTLLFLVRQHFENSAREQEMWKEQREKLIFDKYNAHKSQFISLLSEYEQTNSYGITIRNKNAFYRKVFPSNTLSNFNVTLSENDFGAFHPILVAYSFLEVAYQEFHRIAIRDQYDPEKLIVAVSQLLDALQISIHKKGMGDVLLKQTKRHVNCFDTQLILTEVEELLVLLLDFVSRPTPKIVRTVHKEGQAQGYLASKPIDRIATYFINKSDGFFISTDFGHRDVMKKMHHAFQKSKGFCSIPKDELVSFQHALSFIHFSKDWEQLRLARSGASSNESMLFDPNDSDQVDLFIEALGYKLDGFLQYQLPTKERQAIKGLKEYLVD